MPTLEKEETAYAHMLEQVLQAGFGQSLATVGHRRRYS